MTKYKHRQSEFYNIFRESKNNEEAIRSSVMCSCFSCGKKFFSSDIRDWAISEDGEKKTAICPLCDADTVIPDDGRGYINRELLEEANRFYKERIEPYRFHK